MAAAQQEEDEKEEGELVADDPPFKKPYHRKRDQKLRQKKRRRFERSSASSQSCEILYGNDNEYERVGHRKEVADIDKLPPIPTIQNRNLTSSQIAIRDQQ